MTKDFPKRSWLVHMRSAVSSIFRARHYAVTEQPLVTKPKLQPIAKILADTGRRDPASPVD